MKSWSIKVPIFCCFILQYSISSFDTISFCSFGIVIEYLVYFSFHRDKTKNSNDYIFHRLGTSQKLEWLVTIMVIKRKLRN